MNAIFRYYATDIQDVSTNIACFKNVRYTKLQKYDKGVILTTKKRLLIVNSHVTKKIMKDKKNLANLQQWSRRKKMFQNNP